MRLINLARAKKVYEINIPLSGWSSEAPYSQIISVQGILETDYPFLYPIWNDNVTTRKTEQEEYSKITVIDSQDDCVVITCDEEKPTIDLNARIEVTY